MVLVVSLFPALATAQSKEDPVAKVAPGPLSPRDEQATFRTLKGFKVELVASEPDVIDPVAMCFDQRGRLFVCEMIGYPHGGVATGEEKRGRIRMLTDEDGDGVYEKSTVFAEGLRFPTGITPWKNGVIVAVAPDIIYLEDTDGDGKADKKRVLYTGFGLDNIQQIVNSLQWGLDNWVYGVAGSAGGTITSPEDPAMKPVTLRGRGIRFKPDEPGSLEPMSGGGQYGLAADDFQHWFVNTNSQHLRQIVLPDHYLRRNPFMTVPAVSLDIPDHGAVCKLNRISPFEGWRVERTTRRKGGPDAKRFPETELIPGGYVTSSCSPIVYTANLFPKEFLNNTFICEPANNLIHRDILEQKGSVFSAKRGDADCEFLASTDNWFRPVHLSVGPEGAVYVLDFYREVIESPLSLPDDIKKKLNVESRQRGRIWRIVPADYKHRPAPRLDKLTPEELVAVLDDPIPWKRYTAQRLLIDGEKSKGVAIPLKKLVTEANTPAGKVHALWTMHGLGHFSSSNDGIVEALDSESAGVRETSLRLAALLLVKDPAHEDAYKRDPISKRAPDLVDDPDPFVRLQAAFTLGSFPVEQATPALVKLLTRRDADVWLQSAVFSSARDAAPAMLETFLGEANPLMDRQALLAIYVTRLAAMVGAKGQEDEIGRALKLLSKASGMEIALLEGLGQGMQNSKRPLSALWAAPPESLKDAVELAKSTFGKAAASAKDGNLPLAQRIESLRLLAYGPVATGVGPLAEMLAPQQPLEIQSAALRALASRNEADVAAHIIAAWSHASPALRTEMLEALVARPQRIGNLLDAVEAQKIGAAQLEPSRVQFLKTHRNAQIRQRATAVLAGLGNTDRKKIVDTYQDALSLKPDSAKGKAVFAKNCAACHRLENVGNEVGANLMAALSNKTKEALLIDILDPSREVDSRYINYRVTTLNGQTFTGILAVETPSSITLRRAEKAEDVILRSQIDEIAATTKSLMPEEFEKQLSKQDVADVIAYLLGCVKVLTPPVQQPVEPAKPTSHTDRKLEGWTVRVDDRLLNGPDTALGTRALRFLEKKLSDIIAVMPDDKLKKLQSVVIVLDLTHGSLRSMQYHPSAGWLKANGYSTDLAKCVHIPRAADLPTRRNINEQPWVILHELAHAYHDQVLGFDEPRIKEAYEKFKLSGHGEKTLLYNGNRVKHYALTNPMEFFAEMTESYFGVNDFFPFNRAELKEAEPEIHELLTNIWKSPLKNGE
jgi:putative membrane-bound dehydrogenase-like protein